MKKYNYYVSYHKNGVPVVGTKYNAVSEMVKKGHEYFIIVATSLKEATEKALFSRYESDNYKQMGFEKTGNIDTVYDKGHNCLVCGESGRCPGKHPIDMVKNGIERYNKWQAEHEQQETIQLSLF
jgi:hypothetical protein